MTTRNESSIPRCWSATLSCSMIIALLGAPYLVFAQTCTGDVTLTTPAEVDAFDCSVVTGDLTVSGAEITNLDGLSSLTSVGGNLSIANNSSLTDLSGLSSLAAIGGTLHVQGNDVLTQLDGLSELASVGGSVLILRNTALGQLHGLSSLASIGGTLRIWSNFALTNVDGLSSLTSAGSLDVTLNFTLTRCCGLYPLLSGSGVADTITLADNGGGCNSEQDVLGGGPCITAVNETTWSHVKRRYR